MKKRTLLIELGKRIKEQRLKRNMSQLQLAKLIGITQGTISRYEKGVSMIDIKILFYMVQVLNVSTDYILGLNKY